jgi:hypothetical protein
VPLTPPLINHITPFLPTSLLTHQTVPLKQTQQQNTNNSVTFHHLFFLPLLHSKTERTIPTITLTPPHEIEIVETKKKYETLL